MSAGVLVLHAWWGLNDDVRAYAERLRREGYSAVTPDLYEGRVATTRDEATTLSHGLDQARAMSEIEKALTELAGRADRRAVLGWSLGASLGGDLAQARADQIHALVSYYGPAQVDANPALPPALYHVAEDDEFETLDDVRRSQKALAGSGRVADLHVYPGTKHWFDEPSRPEYDTAASALAWQRTVTFLDTHLRR